MPDLYMDVDVALSEVPVNKVALIDDTDFKTREESVTYDQAGMDLVWNFVTTAGAMTQTAVTPTTSGVYDWTNQGNGMYSIEIPASGGGSINNDTEGFGWFTGFATGILPWTGPTIGFRAAATNNALIDGNLLDSEDAGLLYKSTIGTVSSQTVFLMDTDIVSSGQLVGKTVACKDASAAQSDSRYITAVNEATEEITINAAFPWTVVAGDTLRVFAGEHPAYSNSVYDAATGTELATLASNILRDTQLMLRKDAGIATDNSARLSAINADEGNGAGNYDNTTDSLEAREADLTAVKTKTDQLAFGATNSVDANLKNVADGSTLTSSGTGGQNYGES
jgi:hypothetical protein